MTTVDLITALFYEVDEQMGAIPTPPKGPPLAQGGGHLGAAPRPQRRGQAGVLSLAAARLSRIVSPAPRAPPALSPVHAPSRLDAELLGRSDGAWASSTPTASR